MTQRLGKKEGLCGLCGRWVPVVYSFPLGVRMPGANNPENYELVQHNVAAPDRNGFLSECFGTMDIPSMVRARQ